MKTKLVHLLCVPEQQREIDSAACLSPLTACGIEYTPHVNSPFKGVPPKEKCRRPHDVITEPPFVAGKLWAGHYGAWEAHKRAVQTEFSTDFLMVCECDCWLVVKPDAFAEAVAKTCKLMRERDIAYVSLGNMEEFTPSKDFLTTVTQIFRTHCILFNGSVREYLQRAFDNSPWDNIDFWLNGVFKTHRMALTSSVYAVQAGQSLIDDRFYSKPMLSNSSIGAKGKPILL